MSQQTEFFQAVAIRNIVRIRVAAVVVSNGNVLVQRPTDEPPSCYAFIGGEYEVGDTFETRIRREFEEETTARVLDWRYLFVVENRFTVNGNTFQGLEHYLEVTLDRQNVESREAHLSQHWLPLAQLQDYDIRPHIVRDALALGNLHNVSHLTVAP
ncbi:MAG: NUDIX domain-containing protein [Acidobacteria bacterium]|jgi:8-oxo-dGTP pyrophosphatase MutT (NUDIX family)|nr:NUDIX domain-containing protein [Acidobacteriota bacterium]